MTINDQLESLSEHQLRTVLLWTLRDLFNWQRNGALPEVSRFAAMLDEAVQYQISKAYKTNIRIQVSIVDGQLEVIETEEE